MKGEAEAGAVIKEGDPLCKVTKNLRLVIMRRPKVDKVVASPQAGNFPQARMRLLLRPVA